MVAGCFALVIDEQLILSLVAAMGKSIVLATTETEIPPTDAQIPGRGCVFVHHSFASCMGGKAIGTSEHASQGGEREVGSSIYGKCDWSNWAQWSAQWHS
ncbi:hypothetical protein PMIT1323_00086 [Prochlorococcus marinus str. MIT 1323]|nr:hypothetical protein PMIT1323_00086 [Prochlorococcus marinus str. MIT 1323]